MTLFVTPTQRGNIMFKVDIWSYNNFLVATIRVSGSSYSEVQRLVESQYPGHRVQVFRA
jgi:hypothetical protein